MATKIFCDTCNNEIIQGMRDIEIFINSVERVQIDLCQECYKEMLRVLKSIKIDINKRKEKIQ